HTTTLRIINILAPAITLFFSKLIKLYQDRDARLHAEAEHQRSIAQAALQERNSSEQITNILKQARTRLELALTVRDPDPEHIKKLRQDYEEMEKLGMEQLASNLKEITKNKIS